MRDWHEKHVLAFAKTVFNKQVMSGRYAHLEHPRLARSWQTGTFQALKAKYWIDFDQCEYGLNVDGAGLNRKATTVASNKPSMCRLHRPCSGNHTHVRLLGGTRSHDAKNYPDQLARAIAVLMAAPEGFEKLADMFPVDDDWDMTPRDKGTTSRSLSTKCRQGMPRCKTTRFGQETDSWSGWRH